MRAKESFANRLKQLRDIAGLTQTQLANKLEVSRGSISYYENGERIPDIDFLDKVSTFFDVNVEYLLGYSNNIRREFSEAGLYTGLTDKAISVLFNSYYNIEPLSKLIEHEAFDKFMTLLGYFCEHYEKIETKGSIPWDYNRDYLTFLLTTVLMDIITDIAVDMGYKNITDKDLENTEREFLSTVKKYNAVLKEMEEKAESDFQEYLKLEADSIIVRKKVNEHFDKVSNK